MINGFGKSTLLGLALLAACGTSEQNDIQTPAAPPAIVAHDILIETKEDTAKSATFDTENPEAATLRYVITAQPAHGTLKADGASFTYTPAANYNGKDSFTYEVGWAGGKDSGTVTLHVLPVNDAPTLASVSLDSASYVRGMSITATPVGADDIDGDPVSYSYRWTVDGNTVPVSTNVLPASYVLKGRSIRAYVTPFDAADQGAEVGSGTVVVENTPPVAHSETQSGAEDAELLGSLWSEDADGDPLTYEIVTAPGYGAITSLVAADFTYLGAPDWNGTDGFAWRVSDGTAWSSTVALTLDVAAVNDPPSAAGLAYGGNEYTGGQSITVLPPMIWIDVDGDPAGYLYRWEINGVTVPVAAATLPATYVTKGELIRAIATPFDGQAAGADVVGALKIIGNTGPSAPALNLTTDEDVPLTVTLGSDIDAIDTLAVEIVTAPTHGTLAVSMANAVTYSSYTNYNGTDSFAYRVSDGTAWSSVTTAAITVHPVNDAPGFMMTMNNNQVVDPGTAVTISAFAMDIDGDALTYSWISNGVTVATGNSYTVTAATTTDTLTSLTVRVSDGALYSDVFASVYTKGPGVTGLTVAPGAVTDTWTLTAATDSYSGQAISDVWWRIGGSSTATGSTSISWRGPGIAGIYQIEMKVTDAAGYTGFFTSAAAITTSTQWAGFGNDRQSTGQHWWTESLGSTVVPAPISTTGAVAAVFNVGGQAHLPLSLGIDGTLLGSRWADQFFAIRITDGVTRWTHSTYTFGAKPSVTPGGTAYFGANSALLFALDELTGVPMWSGTFGSGIFKDFPLGSDGRIFKSSDNSKAFQVINPETGVALWTLNLPANLSTNAVVAADGMSYVGAGTDLYAVYADGTTSWALTFPQRLNGVALASDGTVYTGGLDDTLYAVAATGAVKWSINLGQDVQPPKIGADGTVYVKTTNGNLTAVSSTGAFKWKYDCLATNVPAIGADGTIYVPTYEAFVALYPTGAVKWSYPLAGYYFGSPVIDADGYVYAGAGDGNVYKFK